MTDREPMQSADCIADADPRDRPLLRILRGVETGELTTEQAADRVAKLRFRVPPDKTAYERIRDDALGKWDVPLPSSFFPVSSAYAAGRITAREYAALAEAVAKAMRRRQR